ncbi:MAG TPA: serine hydrolase [Terracidiphilus sp.]
MGRCIVLLAICFLATELVSAAEAPSPLTRLLEGELARIQAKSGIYVKHLRSGEEAMVRADEPFESASTIKLATLVLAYQMADANTLKLDERVEITPAALRGGSGIYRFKDVGLRPTLRDILTEMVITSDNTATDIMIAKVGGKDKINAFLRGAGYKVLKQIHTTGEYFRLEYAAINPKYEKLSDEDVFALCCADTTIHRLAVFSDQRKALIDEAKADSAHPSPVDRNDTSRWFGSASPREMGRFVEGIESCTVAKPASCDEMRRMLLAQQAGNTKIPHYLTVPVGHKTGETTGVTNDVGVIYSGTGPIVIAFYNMSMTGTRADTEDAMGRVAQSVVDYFDGHH